MKTFLTNQMNRILYWAFVLANTIAKIKESFPRGQAGTYIALGGGLFLSSTYCKENCGAFTLAAVVVGAILLLLIVIFAPAKPFDLKVALKRNYVFAMMKGATVMLSFNLFEWIGDYLKKSAEGTLICSLVFLYCYIIIVDQYYGLDDDLALTDGLIYALYGAFLVTYAGKDPQESEKLKYERFLIHAVFNILIFFKYVHPEEVQGVADANQNSPSKMTSPKGFASPTGFGSPKVTTPYQRACPQPCCLRRLRRSYSF